MFQTSYVKTNRQTFIYTPFALEEGCDYLQSCKPSIKGTLYKIWSETYVKLLH